MSRARDIADLLDSAGKVTADDLDVGAIGGRRNLIINGAMQIAQRGTSFTRSSGDEYSLDRWRFVQNTSGTVTTTQQADAPSGFYHCIQANVDTADTSLGTTEYAMIATYVEAYDVVPPSAFGTSSAKEMTLSFWHKHSIAGTYSLVLRNGSSNVNLVLEYTQSTSDVWEKATLTVPACTIGTWGTGTSRGISVEFCISNGTTYQSSTIGSWFSGTYYHSSTNQTQVIGTTNAKMRFTGVQLELGSVATPFEHRSYGEELALCQRYFYNNDTYNWDKVIWTGDATSGQSYYVVDTYPVTMRTDPSITTSSVGVGGFDSGSYAAQPSNSGCRWYFNCNSTGPRRYFEFGYTADAEL